jgi:hypothetical protein
MKYIVIIILLTFNVYADSVVDKHIGRTGTKAADLIFPNEKIIEQQYGDLNHDNIKDMLLIVEGTNPSLIKTSKEYGNTYSKNYNPRFLLIAFQDKKGLYTINTVNAKGFIPPQTDRDNENLCVDPFVSISKKGILEVSFDTMMSAGGWEATSSAFLFRFQQDKFFLIGSENSSHSRASGEGSNVSINYLTSNKIITTGLVAVGEEEEHPIHKKVKLPKAPLIELSTMTNFDNYTEFADY